MIRNTIRVCQIGAGLIGQERIKAISSLKSRGRDIELVGIYDPFVAKESDLYIKNKDIFASTLDEIVLRKPDWVFISVPHDKTLELSKLFLSKGFKVLIEKPMGRNLKEAAQILKAAKNPNQLFVGFNYRYYPGIHAAIEDVRNKAFGKIISINMFLGHGGGPKDKKSWKLDLVRGGGGALIDPGIHLIDLCTYIFGKDIKPEKILTWSGSWNTGIEEEAHVMLRHKKTIINIQASIVRWRSTFRLEINGEKAYGIVEGRNRSYGKQTYITGGKWGWQDGKSQRESEELKVESDGNDVFEREIEALLFRGSGQKVSAKDKTNFATKPCSAKEAFADAQLLEKCRELIKK